MLSSTQERRDKVYNLFGGRCCCCQPTINPCPIRPTGNTSVTVGTTTTLEPGNQAYVTNTGTAQNAILNFGIPRGLPGPTGATGATGPIGPQGPAGNDGDAATITVGTVTTLPAGSPVTVTNTGTTTNAVLNFGIPQGAVGETGTQGPIGPQGPAGADGTSATVTVGTVTALAPGATPTVVNSGTTDAAVLDFGIPTVAQGPAVPDLSATATLAEVIASYNQLLASLRTAGVIAQ